MDVSAHGLRTTPVVLLKNPRGDDWNILFDTLT